MPAGKAARSHGGTMFAGTLVVERDATISAADAAGLFLAVIRPSDHMNDEPITVEENAP